MTNLGPSRVFIRRWRTVAAEGRERTGSCILITSGHVRRGVSTITVRQGGKTLSPDKQYWIKAATYTHFVLPVNSSLLYNEGYAEKLQNSMLSLNMVKTGLYRYITGARVGYGDGALM